MLALKPEIVFPGHGQPIEGAENVRKTLTQYRDAILCVHAATVRGMNEEGRLHPDARIKLPPELDVGEGCARSPAVRGIYEGYAGWFDGDAATMYAVSPTEAEAELTKLAGGGEAVAARAQALLAAGKPALALRLTSAGLAAEPANRAVLTARKAALQALLAASGNSNESGWLRAAIAQADAGLK